MTETEAKLSEKVEQLEKRVSKCEERNVAVRKEIFERLNRIEQDNARTDEKYQSILKELGDLQDQQAEILSRLNDLSNRPAKRWDNAVTAIITGIIGALIGMFFGGWT